MVEPHIDDYEALLRPIAEDDPAGPVMYDLRQQIDNARTPRADPHNPNARVPPDWRTIINETQEILSTKTKDLIIATRLIEALTQQYGFEGLRDGIKLLRMLVEQCWDRLNPVIEDGDLTIRCGPFEWLANNTTKPFFPNMVRFLPLFGTREQGFSYLHWEQAQKPGREGEKAALDEAISETRTEHCQELVELMTEILSDWDTLDQLLQERMAENKPDLSGLRQAVQQCQKLVQDVLDLRAPPPSATSDVEAAEEGEGGHEGPGMRLKIPATREAAYQQIARIAQILRQLEPHSPIPYLLERAVELGHLPFDKLIRALVRDANVLAELSREFGLKEDQGSSTESEGS